MQPRKKQQLNNLKIDSSSPMARYLSGSASAPPMPPVFSSSEIDESDLVPAPPSPTALLAPTSQKDGIKTSYIWNHGKKVLSDGRYRWQCSLCRRSYAIVGSSTTNQREHLKLGHGILDPKEPADTKQSNLNNYQ